jgi:hypothetical protein
LILILILILSYYAVTLALTWHDDDGADNNAASNIIAFCLSGNATVTGLSVTMCGDGDNMWSKVG